MPELGAREISDSERRLERIEYALENELLRRLEDEDQAKELPAHSLARLYDSISKRKKPEGGPEEEVILDVLEVVNNTELPDERKRELIEGELALLDGRRRSLEEALDG